MASHQRAERRYRYADYLHWPEDVRYELIDGIAWLISPAPSRHHQELVGEIFRQCANALADEPCRAYVTPFDVRLPKGDEADEDIDTVLQPDVLVVCDPVKLDARGLRGAPDWVVEVLSPASAGHDQTRKFAAYERAGVPEVWLVHPVDLVLTVYRRSDKSDERRYGRPAVSELAGQTTVTAVPDVTIDWERTLAVLGEPD